MLSLLAFKKSLFAGVLDGGDSEVFLHGTKLSRFLDRIEHVTAEGENRTEDADELNDFPGVAPMDAMAAVPAGESTPEPEAKSTPNDRAVEQRPSWAPLVDAGLKLLQALVASGPDASGRGAVATMEYDKAGRAYLKLPMPDPDAFQAAAEALNRLAAVLRG
jgi:hypothetical protein